MEILSIDHVVDNITSYLDIKSKLNFLSSCKYLHGKSVVQRFKLKSDNGVSYHVMKYGMMLEILRRRLSEVQDEMLVKRHIELYLDAECGGIRGSEAACVLMQGYKLPKKQQKAFNGYMYRLNNICEKIANDLAPSAGNPFCFGTTGPRKVSKSNILKYIVHELRTYWENLTLEEYQEHVSLTDEMDLFIEDHFTKRGIVDIPWPEHWTQLGNHLPRKDQRGSFWSLYLDTNLRN